MGVTKDLSGEKYVRLTTFTKDGRRKNTPIWIARWHDEALGTTTDDDSWKVKRLRNTPSVELTPSDGRGNVAEGCEVVHGSAEVVSASDPEYAGLEAAFLKKYGLQYRLFRQIRKLRGKTACGIAIRID